MKLDDLRRSHSFSSTVLFLVAWLAGWSVFNLQVISLIRLLEGAGIEALPALMLVQAACSWALLRMWGTSAQGSPRKFYMSALMLGACVAFVGHHPALESIAQKSKDGWWAFGGIFILSQLIIGALRMGLHVTFSRRISMLSNPQISTQLAISEEFGFMTGVLVVFSVPNLSGWTSFTLACLPFVGGLFVYWLLGAERRPLATEEKRSGKQNFFRAPGSSARTIRRMPPFFTLLIGLFSLVASLKSLQWFGMAFGLSEASRQGIPILKLFSKLSLIQSSLTLTILFASLGFASRIPTWGLGFKVLLAAQGIGAAVLAFFPTPYVLMGGEVLRKVLEHGFLGRSLQLLTATLPEEQRFESRHFMERWSTTSGTAMAGIFAFFMIQGYLPMAVLWGAMLLMAIGGVVLRRRLFDTLSDFHLARLRQSNISGVLQACNVLGNPDSRHHHAALTSLLERNPRPVVKKGLLQALGRMDHAPVVPAILSHVNADREDIQLAVVRAVNMYGGHEINFILLKTLRDMVRSEMPMRLSVIRTITERLGRLVVPYLFEVLESLPDDRVAANAVEILGDVARSEKDSDLMAYLAKFLGPSYPRRVRANAIVVLYHHSVHGKAALECFDRLFTSDDVKEIDAAAYIVGILNLRGHENFILERSESMNHSNITLLVALLRFGNPKAPSLLAQWISSDNEAKAREALIRLSTLPERVRARVFYELVENAPDSLNLVLARTRRTQRDFESDRGLIREEAQRIGLELIEEDDSNAAVLTPVKEVA